MTLVRGSTDRLKLEWKDGEATGPDGTEYRIITEGARGEVVHIAGIFRPGANYGWRGDYGETLRGCPYEDNPLTVRDQKKVCEWDAWDRAGRPSA